MYVVLLTRVQRHFKYAEIRGACAEPTLRDSAELVLALARRQLYIVQPDDHESSPSAILRAQEKAQ